MFPDLFRFAIHSQIISAISEENAPVLRAFWQGALAEAECPLRAHQFVSVSCETASLVRAASPSSGENLLFYYQSLRGRKITDFQDEMNAFILHYL